MKIAFVIQDLFAQGAQYATALMVRGFVSRGYEVDLIVSKVHKDYEASGRTDVFEVPKNTNWIHLKDRKARNNIGELRRYLKTSGSVAVVSMSPAYTTALRIAAIGLFDRPKLIHVEHGLVGYSDYGEYIPGPRRFSLVGLFRWWYFYAFDRVLVVSHRAVDDFKRSFPWYSRDNIRVVNNPVIDEVYYRKIKSPATHPWLRDKSGVWKTFITAGAYEPYKAHKYLLEAMKIVAERGVKARVVIFGKGHLEGEYRQYIETNRLEDYVSIGGYVNNFPAEAMSAHGFVLSSTAESFGIVLVEALACGCQMVSSDPPFGPREILADGKYGILVPAADSRALAEGIIEASKKPRIAQPEESWKRYTIEAAVDKYAEGIGIPKKV